MIFSTQNFFPRRGNLPSSEANLGTVTSHSGTGLEGRFKAGGRYHATTGRGGRSSKEEGDYRKVEEVVNKSADREENDVKSGHIFPTENGIQLGDIR